MSHHSKKLPKEHQIIRNLSDRVVQAQGPIQILNSIQWDNQIKADFFKHKAKKMPKVDADYYQKNKLAYKIDDKREEFKELERDIVNHLGQYNEVGHIMTRMCQEYLVALDLLEARGTKEFGRYSQMLYGGASQVFYVGGPSVNELAETLLKALSHMKDAENTKKDEKCIDAETAATHLQEKLDHFFKHHGDNVFVEVDDKMVADAAAGADRIRMKKNVKFSERELRLLEVHEGWVHVGTTLNGLSQPVCTFLGKAPPSGTVTQEGLAVITEIFTFSSFPSRLNRIVQRIKAIGMAEEGANFLEVYHYYLEQGVDEEEAYDNTMRVFRGSTPDGQPFTKDLAYNVGFISIYNYIRLAVSKGLLDRIPLLFLGKIALEDMRTYADLMEQGIIVPPKYVPPVFQDAAAVSSWMCYSLFLNKISLDRLAEDYEGLL
ncbi:MAG: flavohemoglobin expression-modulating QEGLA motif protein [Legionellaceae bacterium]|nr:flavohemoglobin expression-modulating QEGLA motif protein [Legionellaceae bacterium]